MSPVSLPRLDLSTVPLSHPPPGEVSNFVNSVSYSWSGRLAIFLTLPFSLVAVALRAYVRIQNRQLGVDDYLLLAATVTTSATCGTLLPTFLNDVLGRHSWNIPVSALTPVFFECSLTETILYSVSAILIKASVLVLCIRIFHSSRRAVVFIRTGIIAISLFHVTLSATFIYYFVPRAGDGGWGSRKNTARSIYPIQIVNFVIGLGSALSDFYVLAIPVYMVFGLQMPLKRRIGVACVFLTGLLPCIISTIGSVYRYQVLSQAAKNDRTWLSVKFQAISMAELNIGILCSCMPVAFPLFKSFARKTWQVTKIYRCICTLSGKIFMSKTVRWARGQE